ncbi:restriction system modified-DNA reader domain-containing protein [Virgisporangium aurantiacum]|uniref:CBS domain-containing protein n=1 Tax=Virgisporangium aurantiacum TaxID=175570 RepID=A0A8J3Z6E7_9ACTN|nr:CBS domain-containing protein [Virgisporangium aurantiacum]GIJ56091.1 hypothetical protein Vau01_036070 [Virgisporangium aurantiacum]
MSEDKVRTRRELLINGRRVRLTDLVEAGLLKPGQELLYRQSARRTHRSVVTNRGRLRLDDGREFDTPSAAAVAAAEVTAVAGWIAWSLAGGGPTLHDLRVQLLTDVAKETAAVSSVKDNETGVAAARDRFTELSEARRRAEAGQPKSLTVRDMLRLWGADDRDREVTTQIDADLANHGLTTEPDFRAVSLDRVVRMVTLEQSPRDPSESLFTHEDPARPVVDADQDVETEIGLTLGNLLPARRVLVSVSPGASFEEAVTAMQLNDFSQLPVLVNPRTLHGTVSWKSIAEAKHLDPDAVLADAIDRTAQVFDYDTRLLDVLKVLREDGFLFVRDYDRTIIGIITGSDVVGKYDETATPFFLIGEVDQELRQVIHSAFTVDEMRDACKKAGLSFRSKDELTIGQYQAVLDNPACWAKLGWRLSRKLFVERLNELRKVRNAVMHFNPDPVNPHDVEKLRNFLNLIRKYKV